MAMNLYSTGESNGTEKGEEKDDTLAHYNLFWVMSTHLYWPTNFVTINRYNTFASYGKDSNTEKNVPHINSQRKIMVRVSFLVFQYFLISKVVKKSRKKRSKVTSMKT